MRIYTTFLLFLILLSHSTFAQRILLNQNFENSPYTADSLPMKWVKFKVNGPGQCTNPPLSDWRIRDSGKTFCNMNASAAYNSKAHLSLKSLSIPMTATTGGVTDDWVFTDSLNIVTGDSLKFWIQLGTYPGGGQFFADSLQIWITTVANPTGGSRTRIGTILSASPSQNFWQFKTYDLSSFNGQKVYVGFRYNMNVTFNGLRVNLDDVFVGNLSGPPLGTGTQHELNISSSFILEQNYPNPFNPVTTIGFQLPVNNHVKISIFNVTGSEIAVLVNEFRNAGSYRVSFDGAELPSGIYICKMTAGDFTVTRKMSLMK